MKMGRSVNSASVAEKKKARQRRAQAGVLTEYYPALIGLLRQVEEEIRGLVGGGEEVLGEASEYVVFGRGKRLRPALLLLAAEACGGADARAVGVAATLELVHTASLVHDDVVDEAAWRRGKASARSLWGNKISVLLGDYLLCQAFSHLHGIGTPSMLERLFSVAVEMCEGQIAELSSAGPALSEARYLEIVAGKTASLFTMCGRLGAECACAPEAATESLGDFAHNFGMAFQVADDIHDLIGDQGSSGKPVNHDLRERKVTLPLIFSLRQLEGEREAFLRRALSAEAIAEEELSEIRRLAVESGGVDYAWGVCHRYLEKARQALKSLPEALPGLRPQAGCPQISPSQQAYQALLLTCGEGFPLPVISSPAP